MGTKALNIEDLIVSGKILASALFLAKELAHQKVTPLEIDSIIGRFISLHNAEPSFVGIDGYKFSSCISINNQVVHGVPTSVPIVEGDIVTVDIGVRYNGHCTDAARTFIIGNYYDNVKTKLVNAVNRALEEGIKAAVVGNKVGNISFSIQKVIESNGFRSPLYLGGHGIGFYPHTFPFIPNYGVKNKGRSLVQGMCLAIEPIAIAGSKDVFLDEDDGFSVYSCDGSLSAHSEDSIVITDSTPYILTRTTLDGRMV